MAKNTLFLLIFLLPIYIFSQEKTEVEVRVKQYSKKIDSITTAEMNKMDQEMEKIDQDIQNGKISEKEGKLIKKEISEKYEKIINEKIENEKTEVEEITRITVNSAIFNNFRNRKDSTKIKHPNTYLKRNYLDINYAFLNLTKEKGSINPFEEDSEMRIGRSHSFEIQLRRQRQLFGKASSLFINYGLAYRTDTYMPKRPQVFIANNNQLLLENFSAGRLKRSKFRNAYITFPVDFVWVLNPQYTTYKDQKYLDASKKQWRVGVGFYAGILTRSIVKVKYYAAEDGKFDKYQDKTDVGVNSFLFGAKLSMSYGGFNLFLKKDLTPIFNQDAGLTHKNGIHLGVDISNLGF